MLWNYVSPKRRLRREQAWTWPAPSQCRSHRERNDQLVSSTAWRLPCQTVQQSGTSAVEKKKAWHNKSLSMAAWEGETPLLNFPLLHVGEGFVKVSTPTTMVARLYGWHRSWASPAVRRFNNSGAKRYGQKTRTTSWCQWGAGLGATHFHHKN